MPELPEVETVARQLAPQLVGATLRSIAILDRDRLAAPAVSVSGRLVHAVERWGKVVVVSLAGEQPYYVGIHLRMTGRLKWCSLDSPREPHLRAVFTFDRGEMRFHDVRRFGTIAFCADAATLRPSAVDPTGPAFTVDWLRQQLATTNQAIKSWLLRQDRLVGLGNIYCSEILYQANVSPERGGKSLQLREIRAIHAATQQILARAIENCGTTFSDFQDSHGEIGSYGQYLKVYQRDGQPCERCGRPIQRVVQQQRSTFFCASCQR